MLTVSLSPDFRLDYEATRAKMLEKGIDLVHYYRDEHRILVALTKRGRETYQTEDEAISALCDCFVEKI